MQRRRPKVAHKPQSPLLNDLQLPMSRRAFLKMVLGIDIETTSRFPELAILLTWALSSGILRNTVAVELTLPTLNQRCTKKKVSS